jgi:hypothetical protein
MNVHGYLWIGSRGGPGGKPRHPPPPSIHVSNDITPLSLLTWQLSSAQEPYQHLSTPPPPPNVHTLDYVHNFIEYMSSAVR